MGNRTAERSPRTSTRPSGVAAPETGAESRSLGRRALAELLDTYAGLRDGLPPADELVLATMMGALGAVVVNAVGIAAFAPWPAAGLGLRLQHHFFDAFETLGVAAMIALLGAGLLGVIGRRGRLRALSWPVLTVASMVPMYLLLWDQLEREANSVLDGRFAAILYPTYIVLCGLAVPFAYAIGRAAKDSKGLRWGCVLLGLGAMVGHHFWLRDDYPGVHAAVQWASVCLLGAPLAPGLVRKARIRERRQPVAVGLGVLALVACAWQPPNRVRIELWRECGSSASYALALSLWSAPPLAEPPSSIPPVWDPVARPHELAPLGPDFPAAPVVVLLTVEALRADVLFPGAHDELLPNLARLRDEGAYFARALSAGSQTAVTLSTLFTSRYFSQLHWAMYGQGPTRFLYAADDPTPRFPELLSAAGVQTSSFLGVIFVSGRFGLARGFSDEFCAVQDRRHAMAVEILGPLMHKLSRGSAGPLFAYSHVMEPHEPYDRGTLKEGTDFERYLSEVAVVDQWVGRIRQLLATRYPHRGYLIVTGDHGEAFGEHGTHFHTKTLYDELVRVPLLIWGPGIKAGRYQEPAGHIDLAPTLLQLFRQSIPPAMMGQSLLPLLQGQVARLDRPLIAEGRLRHAMITRDGLKVIDDTWLKTVEAYDLVADPGELHSLFDEEHARFDPVLAELRAFFAKHTLRLPGYSQPYKR